jgi:asparagine synthase (glutamine-hydrolysing)
VRDAFAGRAGPGAAAELPGAGGTERTLCLLSGRVTSLDAQDPRRALALAYERRGDDVVRDCEGSFAFVLWDRERGCGVAARDPLGHHSLFFRADGDAVLVASELRELLAVLPSLPSPDEVAVAHWLAGTGVPLGRTLYEGVRRLPPGSLLRLGAGPLEPVRWWQPALGAEVPAEDAPAFLREAMGAAVWRALEGADEPAVLLSGGFDSGAVAALGRPPVAYSAVFPAHAEVDESQRIAATRARVGARGVERRVSVGRALGAALEFLLAHHVPPASPNGFIWRALVRGAAADGVTALLDGEGGDELFGCAPFLIADALRAARPDAAVRLARALPGMGARPRARWIARALRRYGLRGALPPGAHAVLRRGRGSPGPGEGWLRDRLDALHRETYDPWAWKRAPGPRWRAALLFTLVDGSDALTAHDQLRLEAQLCGLEFRHPFRDPRLLEDVLRLDPRLAFDPHLDRPLARRAMAGLLPDEVRLSDRKPHFNPLLETALAGPDAAAVRELLGDPRAEVRAYLRPEALDERLARDPRSLAGGELLGLWRALALECWLLLAAQRARLEALAEMSTVAC